MYRRVAREEIADALIHLRGLFRRRPLVGEKERRSHERREIVTKNLLSNLFRTKDHPTLSTVMEVAEIFSLTLDGAHRLFGYDLAEMQGYDHRLNSDRTHVLESYSFRRDFLIDLPAYLASEEAFSRDAALQELIPTWQTDIPIRVLEEQGWLQAGVFYIRVGTMDSAGCSLPAGCIALVEPIGSEEINHPNPRSIYFLQFGNGYRCSRCVVTRGRLLLLVSGRSYTGPQEFRYPGGVRIVGRIRAFALSLPAPVAPPQPPYPPATRGAPLVLPWEHRSLDRLFAAKHQRFQRSPQEQSRIREVLERIFHSRFSERTERRYRYPTRSQPHVDTLLQLSLKNMARYTDALRAQRLLISDAGRFSLQTLLNATDLDDVGVSFSRSSVPQPHSVWEARRKEFVEWPELLSAKIPQLRSWGGRVMRLGTAVNIQGIEPTLAAGSLLVLGKTLDLSGSMLEKRSGWSRPIYLLRRGGQLVCGHMDRHGDQFALIQGSSASSPIRLGQDELQRTREVIGISVPT